MYFSCLGGVAPAQPATKLGGQADGGQARQTDGGQAVGPDKKRRGKLGRPVKARDKSES